MDHVHSARLSLSLKTGKSTSCTTERTSRVASCGLIELHSTNRSIRNKSPTLYFRSNPTYTGHALLRVRADPLFLQPF